MDWVSIFDAATSQVCKRAGGRNPNDRFFLKGRIRHWSGSMARERTTDTPQENAL